MKVEAIRKMKTSGDREERGPKRPGDRGSETVRVYFTQCVKTSRRKLTLPYSNLKHLQGKVYLSNNPFNNYSFNNTFNDNTVIHYLGLTRVDDFIGNRR